MEYELVLQHHGIKGQKWGIRRFQTKDGSLTPDGKKRYAKKPDGGKDGKTDKSGDGNSKNARTGVLSKFSFKKNANNAKPDEKNDKKPAEDSKPEETPEERRNRIVKTGTAKEVLEIKDSLTAQQRVDAYNRLQWEQNMKNLAPKEVDAGKERADKFFNNVQTATNYANTAAKAWNTFANVYNAFSDDDVSLPKIDTDLTKGNRDTRRKEKDAQKKAEKAKETAAGGGT